MWALRLVFVCGWLWGPVAWLWELLSGWQQDRIAAAAKTEMTCLAGLLTQPEAAPRSPADRFTDRLEETGGEALVSGPYGWLIRRGLVQRPACSDRRGAERELMPPSAATGRSSPGP
ncbi:hypothetical protein [Streptomyces sp. NPDC050164]|uniref:hypothetical protein n=1 Tax=Streptomyces sp. NPDC050164 TaxID=3365605 RepID=UPI00379CFB22